MNGFITERSYVKFVFRKFVPGYKNGTGLNPCRIMTKRVVYLTLIDMHSVCHVISLI